MATVSETELEQRTSEYIAFVKDFASNRSRDLVFKDKNDTFKFSIFDEDVTLEFCL